jgi:hypothetical protein
MKTKSKLTPIAKIWGIVFTGFMLMSVGSKIIVQIFEDFSEFVSETVDSFYYWYNPTAYFIIYLIGYAIIWWKPILGSIIVIISSIFYMIMGGINGPPIFAVPGLLVGTLYLADWYFLSNKNTYSL